MGTNNIVFPTTTILLFVLLLSLRSTRAAENKNVLDSDGNPLKAGTEYYIQSLATDFPGRITRLARPKQSIMCPLYAVESPNELEAGLPVKFLPMLNTSTHINLSSKLYVDSGFSAYCRDNGIWRLKLDPTSRHSLVIASGVFDVPRTWFTIEKPSTLIGPAYKISTEKGVLELYKDISGLNVLGVTSNDPSSKTSLLNVLFVKKKKTEDDDNVTPSVIN